MVSLGQFMLVRGRSVNPRTSPNEMFELYSISAHDRGRAEFLHGSEIGSPKQLVQSGDVMISKIVPHIRRAQIVPPGSGCRQIASGEWIVFRSDIFDPRYFRHFLLSDQFHAQYMNTVAGVGGSLLRARPAQVKNIPLPLPNLKDQRRIASILDKADSIRAKRRQILNHLDDLTQSIFFEMFHDGGWPRMWLDAVSLDSGKYGASVSSTDWSDGKPRFIRITDITKAGLLNDNPRAPSGPEDVWSKAILEDGDLVFARSGATVGKTYRYRSSDGPCVYAGYLIRYRPNQNIIDPDFLFHYTRTPEYRSWVANRQNVVAQPNINAKQYGRELLVPVPPLDMQLRFGGRLEVINRCRHQLEEALKREDEVFTSLQSRAFKGEL